MSLSSRNEVRTLYDDLADAYNEMMNEEIKLPLYDEILSDLVERIASSEDPVLDTSCGSGPFLKSFGMNLRTIVSYYDWIFHPKWSPSRENDWAMLL